MSEVKSEAEKGISSLRSTVETILSLIAQFLTAIKTPQPSSNDPAKEKSIVNALDLAHDAATLVKAHSTKLSLLIINTPFTPTAITTILRELSSSALPALASSVELLDPAIYTSFMRVELVWRVEKVLIDFSNLVREIPLDGKVLSKERKNGTVAGQGRGSLASTGVVWEACDKLAGLKKMGVVGLLILKAEQYRDTLKDALEELQEWGEETSDGDEEDEEDDEGLGGADGRAHEQDVEGEDDIRAHSAQAAVDALFENQRHIPTNDTDKIRPRLEVTLRKLKLVLLFYRALIKRRLSILPSIPNNSTTSSKQQQLDASTITKRLTALLPQLASIPDAADELASTFYALSPSSIDEEMGKCFGVAVQVADSMVLNWRGERDEFSEWLGKFLARMDEDEGIISG